MKAVLFALTCAMLAPPAASKKLAVDGSPHRQPLARDRQERSEQLITETVALVRHKDETQDEDQADTVEWCQGNVFPSPDATFQVGLSTSPQVFDDATLTALRANLTNFPAWAFDRVWEFKAKVTSGFSRDLTFGMAGGAGFLMFNVTANAGSKTISVKGKVKTSAQYVSVVYRGPPTDLVTHKVTFSKVCLRQQPCSEFAGCLPTSKYKANASLNGDSFEDCCSPIYCSDNVNCTPSSKYDKFPDSATRLGNTMELCCKPKFCSDVSDSVCTGTAKPRRGSGILGSLPAECCESMFCRDFTGCDPTHDTSALPFYLDDGSPRPGFSEEECCNVVECDSFNCSKSDLWTNKSNASGVSGHSFEQCCDPVYCANYTCQATTKYTNKTNPPIQGNSDGRCCEPMYCVNYTCSNTSMTHMHGAATRLGSTDAECCEPAVCIKYNCSDETKYRKKPNFVESGGVQQPRMGGDDEACCTPLYCRQFSCTSTKWSARIWADNDTTLGWTHKQCCDEVFCENYTCTTDYDGDGNGTKWFKRADTNALKWQGSTDEECCYPIYCSQYVTDYPTKWQRKPAPEDGVNLLGSTEVECYDPILCSKFCGCSESQGVRRIGDAASVQGSTVDECCENITTTDQPTDS
eukprot:TRINITY_DN4929_c0_g2_i1.p1 TRINITY_DN4929_c0_g2~~TRINITY_DN4929_c0_g2_i1.p1  ORF type:complete len:635 (+),score=80.38 TRINITY_DN4929_c0_g2_i1:87-1991(+)